MKSEYYTEEEERQQAILADLWPKIAEANSMADTTGQLQNEYVIFAKKERPFSIAGKGTVQRKKTVKRYEPDIEQLYRRRAGATL